MINNKKKEKKKKKGEEKGGGRGRLKMFRRQGSPRKQAVANRSRTRRTSTQRASCRVVAPGLIRKATESSRRPRSAPNTPAETSKNRAARA